MSVSDMSPQRSQPESHSNEVENRLTRLEIQGERHQAKLTLHEKAILGLASCVYVVAQEKFPLIAGIIRGLMFP